MKRTLSPKDLASAIGVSESSLKRWADQGVVRVARTAGGHRRITVADAIDFIRDTRLQLVRPEVLGLPELSDIASDLPREGQESVQLQQFILEGKAVEARGLVMWMFLNGQSMASICDGPIRLAMDRLGAMWADRPDGIFLEHRATDICIQALNQIRATRETPSDAPVVVGGAPSGDPYLVPSLMAATALSTEGFHAVNLGPETPVESLVQAVRIHQPAFVWLSLTSEEDPKIFRGYVRELATRLGPEGVSVIVGGRSASRLGAFTMPNLHTGSSMAELIAFARGFALSRQSPSASAANGQ